MSTSMPVRADRQGEAPGEAVNSQGFLAEPSSSSCGWYLVHSKPRQEQIALTNLERQGYVCYLPLLRIEKIRRRSAGIATEPMFPRYLFIQLDASAQGKSWSPVRSTLGVSSLVHFGTQPARIDDELINILRQREQVQPVEALFHKGETVQVVDGPFAGLEAIFQSTDATQRSIILLELLSKQVSMRIDPAWLRKAG